MIETVRAPGALEEHQAAPPGAAEANGPAPGARTRSPRQPRRLTTRWTTAAMAGAAMALLIVLGGLHSTNGFLNDDVAPKAATLAHLARTGDAVLPYWASSIDPDAVLHPLHWGLTSVAGGFVAVSTAPDLIVLRLLGQFGGRHAQLLLPALGAVLTALGVRSLTRTLLAPPASARTAGDDDPATTAHDRELRERAATIAFVGALAGTPLLVYGLEIWEHTLGLAGGVWSIALLAKLATETVAVGTARTSRWWLGQGALAGLVLGLGAALRNEVLLQSVIVAGVLFASIALRRGRAIGWARIVPVVLAGVAFVAGLGLVLLANRWCERSVLGTATHAAKASIVARGDGSGPGRRAATAAVQVFGWWRSDALATGVAFVVALAVALRTRRRSVAIASGSACLVLLALRLGGVGTNVPGILTTSPLAIAGLGRLGRGFPQRAAGRTLLLGTALAVAATAALARRDGYLSLWGARYYLLPAVLLAGFGAAAIARRSNARQLVAATSCTVMSLLGVSFLTASTQLYDGLSAQVVGADVPVISREPFLLRNLAMASAERAAFTATSDPEAARAIRLLLDHGATCIVVLAAAPTAPAVPTGITVTPGFPNAAPPIGAVRAWTLRTGAPCRSDEAVRAAVQRAG